MLDASLTSLTRLGGLAVDASAVTEEVRASRRAASKSDVGLDTRCSSASFSSASTVGATE